jgi:hypothetical protein
MQAACHAISVASKADGTRWPEGSGVWRSILHSRFSRVEIKRTFVLSATYLISPVLRVGKNSTFGKEGHRG